MTAREMAKAPEVWPPRMDSPEGYGAEIGRLATACAANAQVTSQREGYFGSSSFAAAFGLNRWTTPLRLWQKIMGKQMPDDEQSDAAYWGTQLEPMVLYEVSRRYGAKVQVPRSAVIHRDHPWLRANLDGIVMIDGKRTMVEAKTCSAWKADEWGTTGEIQDDIPTEYLVQVNGAMEVAGLSQVAVAVLIGGQECRHYLIPRSARLAERCVVRAVEWWNEYVVGNKAPMPETAEEIRELFPNYTPSRKVEASDSVVEHLRKLARHRAAAKESDDEMKKLKPLIGAFIRSKGGDTLVDSEGNMLATYKTNAKGSDVFLLKKGGEALAVAS